MKTLKLKIVLMSILLGIISCGNSFDKFSRNDGYLNKNLSNTQSIAIPKGLNSDVIENYYPIPKSKSKNTKVNSDALVVPPGFNPQRVKE